MPTATKRRATAAANASKATEDVPAAGKHAVERSASPNSTDTGVQLDQDQQARPMEADQQQEQQQPAAAQDAPEEQDGVREGTPSSLGGSQGAGGLVSNTQPITEEEAQTFWAPEEVLLEEERLRQEREEQNRAAAAAASAQLAVLSNNRFAKLDALLTKAGAYSSFLSEQLQSTAAKLPTDLAAAAAAAAGPSNAEGSASSAGTAPGAKAKAGKRKSSGKAAQAAKRQKKGSEEQEVEAKQPTQELLPLIVGEMREYQLQGVRWLISLYQNGLNGILADQMGLGKTVQTIGFLSNLYANGIRGPFMVVGPLSTLGNWVAEFERWAPSIPVCMYHGSKADRAALRAKHMGREPTAVICTSFEIVMADIKLLSAQRYKYLVVDEGHRLKNFECKLIRELRTLPVENRLLLTGTPLQNDLSELWSLLNFLQPDIFTSLSDFEDWFDFTASLGAEGGDEQILAAEQRNKVVSKLHACLKPFLLRRVKADVEISLPRKQEILLYADMSEQQRQLNKQLLDKTLQDEMAKLAAHEGGSHAAVGKLNNVLMQMRKNCNHPDLITAPFTSDLDYPTPEEMVASCGKMALMERLMDRLKAGGHKVLIFSQMTKMLDLLESYLEQKGEKACRIDGSVPWQERQAAIQSFNSDPSTWVFLLSTRAGGLGINLTAADTVIIYDSDWNPQQDLQAMDRCHRIGQTRPVQVFRLATGNSVEGRMLSRAAHKMALERLVIKKGVFKEVVDTHDNKPSSMSAAELVELLRTDGSSADKDVPQSGVVDDAMLERLMDRTHLAQGLPLPYAAAGVGYEVVAAQENSALLTGVQ